jgi:hypothetical protein
MKQRLRKLINDFFWSNRLRPFQFLPLRGVGVEVGVWRADFSLLILKHKDVTKLYLVDPYVYVGEAQMSYESLMQGRKMAVDRMSRFKNRVEWISKNSIDALGQLPEKLDFVYLDGDHKYETVKTELPLYWDRIAPGGILGGHDFNCGWPGDDVIKAVTEFTVKNGLKLNVSSPDWWIVKT